MKKGFTLTELMIVIVIIALMSGAVAYGFSSFFHTISVQNAPGQIGDILDQLSREAITRNYSKSSVSFEEEYLLVDSQVAEAGLNLTWSTVGCGLNQVSLQSDADSWLFTSDPNEDPLKEPLWLAVGTPSCIDPLEFTEREVIMQLKQNNDVSNKIRIFPLNLNLNPSDDIEIESNNYRLDILQPYGKKELYENDTLLPESQSASITIKSQEDDATLDYELQ